MGNSGRVTSVREKRLKRMERVGIRARLDCCHRVSMINEEIRSLFVFYGFELTFRETKEGWLERFACLKSSKSERNF